MSTFRQLTGDKAKLEFFLAVMCELTTDDEKAVETLFAEAEKGEVLPPQILTTFKEKAKRAIPIEPFVSDPVRIKVIRELRDELSVACGIEQAS